MNTMGIVAIVSGLCMRSICAMFLVSMIALIIYLVIAQIQTATNQAVEEG